MKYKKLEEKCIYINSAKIIKQQYKYDYKNTKYYDLGCYFCDGLNKACNYNTKPINEDYKNDNR
jgi:hypothetical protein